MVSCLTANCYWFVNTFKKTYDPNFFQILLPILYVIDLFYQQKQKQYMVSNMDKVDLKKKLHCKA